MAQKNNIRSIRFSDEMADLIDRQIGDTFTQKFENLITRCVWELPQKEKELQRIQEQINQRRQQLADLQKTGILLKRLSNSLGQAQENIKDIVSLTKNIAEAAEKAQP